MDPVQKLLSLLGENGEYVRKYRDLSRKIEDLDKKHQQEMAQMGQILKRISEEQWVYSSLQVHGLVWRDLCSATLKRAVEHGVTVLNQQLFGEEDVPGGMGTPT